MKFGGEPKFTLEAEASNVLQLIDETFNFITMQETVEPDTSDELAHIAAIPNTNSAQILEACREFAATWGDGLTKGDKCSYYIIPDRCKYPLGNLQHEHHYNRLNLCPF